MRRFQLNKLVRDNIVEDMQRLGQKVEYCELNQEEYLQALQGKLIEEAREISLADPGDALKELADVQEVIDQLTKEFGADKQQLQELQAKKNSKAGSFQKKLYVKTVTLKDDDPWAEYYAKDPDRFKEIKGA